MEIPALLCDSESSSVGLGYHIKDQQWPEDLPYTWDNWPRPRPHPVTQVMTVSLVEGGHDYTKS